MAAMRRPQLFVTSSWVLLSLLLRYVNAQNGITDANPARRAPYLPLPLIRVAADTGKAHTAVSSEDRHELEERADWLRSGYNSTSAGTSWFGVVLAGVGGSLSATGANALAWSTHRTRSTGQEWSSGMSWFFYALCFVLNLTGISMFAASTALGGAVAVVMPIQTGANLLMNMFWQISLGIKRFNKEMRLGTLVLLCAVAELSEIGPNAPAKLDILRLLEAPRTIIWILFLVVCSILGAIASYVTFNQPVGSVSKLCSITMVVSLTTVIGASVSKCFGILSGFELVVAIILYLFDGMICMAFTVIGNAQCDVSIYIPLQLASQLVLNMFTGFFVWGDGRYIDKPVAYLLVYVISVLGVYLISPEMDTVGQLVRLYHIRKGRLSRFFASSDFGKAVLRLLGMWQQQRGEIVISNTDEQAVCVDAMRDALHQGLEQGFLQHRELVLLAVLLLKEKGMGPNATFVHWMEHHVEHFKLYIKHDPNFQEQFRETLSSEEREKLLSLVTSSIDGQSDRPSGISLQGHVPKVPTS